MNLTALTKPPIGATLDPSTWVYLPRRNDLNELAYKHGPERTKAAYDEESNYVARQYSDVAADIMGLAVEAYSMDYVGYDPHDPAHIWVYPKAPPAEQADFGPYECKRTNDTHSSPKYRTLTNSDHIILQGWVKADVDGDDVNIHGVYLLGWYQPRADHAYSMFAGYDKKGRELRKIKAVRRRPMSTLPMMLGVAA